MVRSKLIVSLLMAVVAISLSQLKIIGIEKVKVPAVEQWMTSSFSPTGKELLLTNQNYSGIWQFSLETNVLKEITRDQQSGYQFSVSEDGQNVAYRRTIGDVSQVTRRQESVIKNIASQSERVIETGNSISTLIFIHATATSASMVKSSDGNSSVQQATAVMGIEETKIILLQNGKRIVFDPFGNGQYIWPSLSPNSAKIAAVEMGKGAFVCDINGTNVQRIGRCDAPVWTNDGKWIIGMDDKDDGIQIISSDIIAVSPDGKQKVNLTEALNVTAMFPNCSLVDHKIVFTTSAGEVYVMTYEEGK